MENTNTGNWNTGDCNTGNWNTGNCNTGNTNTGNWNTGDKNTGNCNTGNWNTGDWNTGNWNTGDWNSGKRNTGDWNTGDKNTGDKNTGNWNTGDWNTGDRNTGFFNTITPKWWYIFNKWCDDITNIEFPDFCRFALTEWINENDMTEREKESHPEYKTTWGYLKEKGYKEAFQESFYSYSERERKRQVEQLKKIPNFDKDIFYEISWIDIEKEDEQQ